MFGDDDIYLPNSGRSEWNIFIAVCIYLPISRRAGWNISMAATTTHTQPRSLLFSCNGVFR